MPSPCLLRSQELLFGQSRTLVFRGAKVYPVSSPPLENGLIVVENGKIKAVGAEGQVAIPPDATVVDVSGKIIIPGIVDTHSHIGIAGRPPVSANADVNESTGPVAACAARARCHLAC